MAYPISSGENFSASTDWRESRQALKATLMGKVSNDHDRVFARLGINDIDDALTKECADGLLVHLVEDIEALKALVKRAELKPISQESAKPAGPGNPAQGPKSQELEMYPHLSNIFDFVASFGDSPPRRRFCNIRQSAQKPNENAIQTELLDLPPGFPQIMPDYALYDSSDVRHKTWGKALAFGEIKATSDDDPNGRADHNPTDLITQAADYARVHFAARLFLLFSVGLVIFGSKFCVAIFDRDGVVLSNTFNMWNDMAILVKVIRSVCCHLSLTDLGRDPTVRPLPASIRRDPKDKGFEMFLVGPIGEDRRIWCTVGLPLWTSLTTVGRGTVVWRVVPYEDNELDYGTEMVLKTAWRKPGRTSEAEIYQILGVIPGLARYVTGCDVVAPSGDVITVQWLRQLEPSPGIDEDTTPILHRLITRDVGCPLWEYKTDLQLLQALKAILVAHKLLSDRGVVHCDISPGNILLAGRPDVAGVPGILHDVEFARIPDDYPAKMARQKTEKEHAPQDHAYAGGPKSTAETSRLRTTFDSSTKRGADMTGTLLFMSVEVLEAIHRGVELTQTAGHDIESFAIVLSYTVLRNIRAKVQGNSPEAKVVEKVFRDTFGHHSVTRILDIRQRRLATSWAQADDPDPLNRILDRSEIISPSLRILIMNIDLQFDRLASANTQSTGQSRVNRIKTRIPVAQSAQRATMSYAFLAAEIDEAIAALTTQP